MTSPLLAPMPDAPFHGPPLYLLLFILYLGTLSANPAIAGLAETGLFLTMLLIGMFICVLVVSLLIAHFRNFREYYRDRNGVTASDDREIVKMQTDNMGTASFELTPWTNPKAKVRFSKSPEDHGLVIAKEVEGNHAAATGSTPDPSDVNILKRAVNRWYQMIGTVNPPVKEKKTPDNITATPPEVTKFIPKARVYFSASQPQKPMAKSVFNRKIYCSHWVRTGECTSKDQPCVFDHVMPDLTTLSELEFPNYPRWYRERAGIYIGAMAFGEGSQSDQPLATTENLQGHNPIVTRSMRFAALEGMSYEDASLDKAKQASKMQGASEKSDDCDGDCNVNWGKDTNL